jgi:hypothetical protein
VVRNACSIGPNRAEGSCAVGGRILVARKGKNSTKNIISTLVD